MPRGKPKGGHKGRMKRYLTAEEIAEQEERKQRELEWKKKKGLPAGATAEDGDVDDLSKEDDGATVDKIRETKVESSSEEEEESDSEDDVPKSKGVEGLIEIENPNRVQQKGKKVQNVDVNAKVELSRREREEIQKQKDTASYRKKHESGLTDEAQRDLARLAIIKQQREEAAKKRKEAESKAAAKEKKK